MLARARQMAPAGLVLDFVLADATIHKFEPGGADLFVSRFGVMFFADPALSFRNMRMGLRSGGRLAFACWRDPARNPWMLLPLLEALKYVPPLPEAGPEDPGPFAFAREARVRRILDAAGFSQVTLEPVDLQLDLAMGRGLETAVSSALDIGPVRRALEGQPQEVLVQVEGAVRAAFALLQKGATVPLGASVWIATAVSQG
jgi:SAM-dependent methyltransferase